ncbi:MAG: hypothetical protein J5809_02025 [Selenomonadaceae bacterium]|nr:hypothetical protein [Selenomonadaceae bacterium]
MAEEIKNNEILKDEQLEQVAGGYAIEIENDINRLKFLGVLPPNTSSDALVSEQLLKDTLYRRYKIDVETSFANRNEYRYCIDGRYYDRKTVWRFICDREGRSYFE